MFVRAGEYHVVHSVEASALTHAQRRGLFARRSPLLRFQDDESLVALTRRGHQHAFEALVERYQARLLGFCRQMLGSTEDAEDVLQEVFVAAYNAMIADERKIAVRPWLYRIARNRCLNHLRKPTADGQDTMDVHPHMHGVTTLERVQNREDFRNLLEDVTHLPETQRSALLLREIDAMSYEEIAQAMDTTVPGVKSLLVRARIALAESSQARQLSCDEVRVQLAEAIEGLAKVDGAARRHIKACEQCSEFRTQLRKDSKVLAALFPAGPLLALKGLIVGKLTGLFGGGAAGGTGAGAGAAGAGAAAGAGGTAATGAAVGGAAAAAGGAGAAGAAGAAAAAGGAAIGTKAAAGLATAALLAGGAVEVKNVVSNDSGKPIAAKAAAKPLPEPPPPLPPPPEPKPEPVVVLPVTEPVEEIVPPVEGEEAETGGVLGPQGRKQDKEETASADGSQSGTPVGGGVSSCDADGDGATDPNCSSGTTTQTDQAAVAPESSAAEIERAEQRAKQKRKAEKKRKAKKRKAKKRKAKKRKAKTRKAKLSRGGVPAR